MKTTIKQLLIATIAIIGLSTFSSCEKDEGKAPSIEFKTDAGYVSGNQTIAKGAAFVVGIKASKSEKKDVLKTINVSYSYDGAATTTTYSNDGIDASQEDNYDHDFALTARNQTGTERWIFTVSNKDGIINSVEFTLTVN